MENNTTMMNNEIAPVKAHGLSDRTRGRIEGAAIVVAAIGLIRAAKFAYGKSVELRNRKLEEDYLNKENDPGTTED